MLNPDEIRLCGLMVRRAGFALDDIKIQLGIEHIRAGKEWDKPWHPLLATLLNNLYNERNSDG